MRRPLAIALVLFAVAGCGEDAEEAEEVAPPGDSRTFTVDCLGMYNILGQGGTLVPLLGDESTFSEDEILGESGAADVAERCRFWVTGPLREGPLTIKNHVSNLTDPGSGTLFIRYQGEGWVMRSGSMVMGPEPFMSRATGWYDGVFEGPGGKSARIRGLMEWCEPSREDCPYKIASDFGRPFQVSTPLGDAWGEANECRVLIDRASGGMQVDLQIGSWRGVNVGQLWNRGCGQERRVTVNANRFTFQSGGVTGPGRYGPWRTSDFEGHLLPHMAWTLPATFWFHERFGDWSYPLLCGELFADGGFRTQTDGRNIASDPVGGPSICEFEVIEDPGTFKLSCSRVIPTYSGNAGRFTTRQETGEVHLTAACDVRYKP